MVAAPASLFAVSVALRTQRELTKQLEGKWLARAAVFETARRNAVRGDALMEELVGQRLLDNARLVDQLLLSGPIGPEALERIGRANHLVGIELLDRDGRPRPPPEPTATPAHPPRAG